ncbi:MAG: copper chaperone PCu(A)C [Motiliproteus sp.]
MFNAKKPTNKSGVFSESQRRKGLVRRLPDIATLFFCLLGLTSVQAESQHPALEQGLLVHHGWVRAVPPVAAHSAAYMTIINNTDVNDRLLKARSDISEAVEIHNVMSKHDVVEMAPVEQLDIPARSHVQLKEGGYHLMMINLKRVPKAEEMVTLELVFEQAGIVTVELPVQRSASAMSPGHHSDHQHQH